MEKQLIEVKLSKEEIKIIRTALTHFDRENIYRWDKEVIDILNRLTSAIHKVDVLEAFEKRRELERQRELEWEKNE
jgi:5-bromo-4-chloroindolyl phosphate hydrolysis protein